ncbi:uncharacterized protein LOC132553533 [Ylistrum balloti]|uniref:uncharacterized protein LOC132553533 n=1 Tax=Ylistrum balloti TaxID=509963 RepID=UPI002905AEE3|nr:uncharacterized protein LOC132553533 [Ylistrum balloti]
MSTGQSQTRHKVFPPQRMHTRSRSNVNPESSAGSKAVKSDVNFNSQREGKGIDGNDTNRKLFRCDNCGSGYKTLGGLRRHQVTHIKPKLYNCGKCPQVFMLKAELERHLQTHSNTCTLGSDGLSVQNVELFPVSLLECQSQVDKLQESPVNVDNDTMKKATSVQKHVKNYIAEFQKEQKSLDNGFTLTGNENIKTDYPVTEVKSDILLEQVLKHCLSTDEGQSSENTVNDSGIRQSSTTLCPVNKNQQLMNAAVAENETFIVVEHGNDITDLLLQDDYFKHSSQPVLKSSNSHIGKEKINIKSGISLLSTTQLGRTQMSSSVQSVLTSKPLVTSGSTVSTTIPTVARLPGNVSSGITTIGHVNATPGIPNHFSEEKNKMAQLSDKHVSIKSHFSKEDIDKEVTDDPVLGLVSGLVKFCPDLSETDYTEVAKVTGVTVIMLDKQKIVVHGSWKALNRAYSMIENLQVEAKKERTLSSSQECFTVTTPLECVAVTSPVEHVTVSSPVECVTVTASLECDIEDQLKQNGVEAGVMTVDDSDPEATIDTSNSVDMDNLAPISMMEPDSFLCDKCSKQFWSRRSLQEHIALRHSEHKCKLCNKVFSERRYLQTHLKRHANIRNYTCSVCGWQFMERFKMKLHMESHKERKDRRLPYKCSMCGNQFYNRASWTDHLNTHTGNRPYTCMLCNNSFAHRIGLKRHMMTHIKEKPYKCGQCDRSFSFRSKLTDHMTMHTGISKHKCSHCGRSFTASSSLRRHMEQCTTPPTPPEPEISETVDMEMTVDVIQATDSDTIFMCGICGETFDSLIKAEKHTVDHEQGVPIVGEKAIVVQDNQEVVFTDEVAILSEPQQS